MDSRPAPARQSSPKLDRILGFGLRLVVVSISLWLVALFAFGDSVGYLGYVNAAGLAFGSLASVGALWFLFRRDYVWSLVSAGLVIAVLAPSAVPDSRAFAAGTTIRVVSASLRTANADMADAAATLLRLNPDIVAMQEVNDARALEAAFRRIGGRRWHLVGGGGLAIATRWPATVEPPPQLQVLAVRLTLPDGADLGIWTFRAPKSYAMPADNRIFYDRVIAGLKTRRPDVVAGDFNATQWNEGYRRVAARMDDSFLLGGRGTGLTFPTPARRLGTFFPWARIDHVFVARDIGVASAFVGDVSRGADHFPVVADLRIPPERQPSPARRSR